MGPSSAADSKEPGANALLAVKCCFKNNRWSDFLDWRACSAAAA